MCTYGGKFNTQKSQTKISFTGTGRSLKCKSEKLEKMIKQKQDLEYSNGRLTEPKSMLNSTAFQTLENFK